MLYKELLKDVRKGVIGPAFAALVATVLTLAGLFLAAVLVGVAIAGFPISTFAIVVITGSFGLFWWYFKTRRYSE